MKYRQNMCASIDRDKLLKTIENKHFVEDKFLSLIKEQLQIND